ncbi:uncharacterized protein LOC131152972 [Malania oleifera]|uniref:uncharacterized protein LOC131152972 n=1 Tax=Malania oleifera TaxID=397392 RepID=UPI0025ADBEC0|nr:uncharacterized protein LOC131152972 [Malania oleifera]
MGFNLFDGDGSDDKEDLSKIEINEEFARRYEYNKKREHLQRLEELKKKGLVDDSSDTDSESSEDDEEDDLANSKKDLEFFDALLKVRNQDPSLKLNETKLFESSSSEDEEGGDEEDGGRENEGGGRKGREGNKKEKKPMYLKDVVARHLIEAGPEFGGKDEGEKVKSYAEEQEEMRRAFLDAAEAAEDSDEGEFLKVKEKKKEDEDGEDDDDDGEFQKKLDQYFGKDRELDENATFLKDYFLNKMWVDKGKGDESLAEDLEAVSEDDEEVEKQEDYERGYNFRYEEGAGDRVLGHARFVDGSVRKKNNARKVQRKRKEERMMQAELERKEELKHLKNLKKQEIIEKRNKIKEIAGIGGEGVCPFDDKDLEDDFDPEDYDRKMKDMFGEDYYDAVDADPEFGSDGDEDGGDFEKPDFGKEDELLGLPKDWDVCQLGKGFVAQKEKKLKNLDDEGDQKQAGEEGKQKRKWDKDMEALYELDYEDTIGDLKTRFKYAKVKGNRYGLKPEEILVMDDKELSQYVSLKKLAPYRDDEWKVPNSKRHEQKMRNKLLLQGGKSNNQKIGKKKSLKGGDKRSTSVMGDVEDGKAQAELNGDMSNVSRRSRRKRHQAELKLSQSRLMAYGKFPPKAIKKLKQ